jgi:hypothetical protein
VLRVLVALASLLPKPFVQLQGAYWNDTTPTIEHEREGHEVWELTGEN